MPEILQQLLVRTLRHILVLLTFFIQMGVNLYLYLTMSMEYRQNNFQNSFRQVHHCTPTHTLSEKLITRRERKGGCYVTDTNTTNIHSG
eukprot:11116622-Ditylum_brightwellii.AAC.1